MPDHLRDYNEVAQRVEGFNEKYPGGTIHTSYDVVSVGVEDYVVVRAGVKKDGESDVIDATGHSWLKIPGSTNFTRGSELENAETSAVGRALAFIGFYAKGQSLASKQEIRAKSGDAPDPDDPRLDVSEVEAAVVGKSGLTDKQKKLLFAHLREAGVPDDQRKDVVHTITGKWSVKEMTSEDLDKVLEFSNIEVKDETP